MLHEKLINQDQGKVKTCKKACLGNFTCFSVHWSEKHFFRKVLPKETFRFVYRGGGQKTSEQVSLTFFNNEFFPTLDRRLKNGKVHARQKAPSTCGIGLTG